MKNGLYIKNQHVDVESTELFLFTYSNNDVVDPQAVKNSYSKTITLKGTPNNNRVFNNIWRLDSEMPLGTNTFDRFNPLQREDFELYDNGNLLERGYIQLNTIKYRKNNPTYEITLFGMLGDFFYNLMYDDKGHEMTLADMRVWDCCAINNGITLGEADYQGGAYVPTQRNLKAISKRIWGPDVKTQLFKFNKDFIWNSWLLNFTDKYNTATRPDYLLWEEIITAAPCYNGLHDDFDNDIVLTNLNYPDEYNNILPKEQVIDSLTYRPRYNYSRLKTQREMDEWEARDLRSNYQRPAIRLGHLMNKISEYSNQKGYNIVWDKDIDPTNQKPLYENSLNDYFWRSYIMLNPFEYGQEELIEYSNLNIPDTILTTDDNEWITNNVTDDTGSSIFVMNQDGDQLQLFVNEEFTTPIKQSLVNVGQKIYTSAYPTDKNGTMLSSDGKSFYGAFVYHIQSTRTNGDIINEKVIFVDAPTTSITMRDKDQESFDNTIHQWIIDKIGRDIPYEFIHTTIINAKRPADENNFCTFENSVQLTLDLDSEYNIVKLVVNKTYMSMLFDKSGKWQWHYLNPGEDVYNRMIWKTNGTAVYHYTASDTSKSFAPFFSLGICDDNLSKITVPSSSEFSDNGVSLNILFANTESPFKYLVDWCKLFNLRFRPDIKTKTIYIEQRKRYFKDEVINIDKKIDYSKEFNIDPVHVEHEIYKYTLENEDSYAHKVYKRANNTDYSTKEVITSYEFGEEPLDVFSDNIYKTNIDYQMRSPYFNTTLARDGIQYPTPTLMPTYDYFLWRSAEAKEKKHYGLQSYNSLPTANDNFVKPCMFDEDNKTLDTMNSLVMFDKLYIMPMQSANSEYRPYLLSDNMKIMSNLNDNKPCFLNSWYDDSITPIRFDSWWVKRTQTGYYSTDQLEGTIGLWSFVLPIMTASCRNRKDDIYAHTYYMQAPSTVYNKYFGNISWGSDSTIYSKFWSKYMADILGTNIISSDGVAVYDCAKTVECNIFLEGMPRDALRKFYYFKNTLWSLQEITDYDYKGHGSTKVKFIKVQNKNNYLL